MKRPPMPSGEVPGVRVNPITHPTVVIRRLILQEEEAVHSPAFLRALERSATAALVIGPFVAGLGLTAPSVPVMVLGFTFIAGGFSAFTLSELLQPEFDGWDARLLARIKSWRKK